MLMITLHPQRRDDGLIVSASGDIISINGKDFDFGPLPDGAILPRSAVACDWVAGDVCRVGGVLHIPLLLPLGPNASEAARFPAPISITQDGPVELPQ